MPSTAGSTDRTAHLLALMKKGDDALTPLCRRSRSGSPRASFTLT